MSVDWLELVFELYGPVEDWPENLKIRIAHSLGYCTRNPGENEKKEALKKLRGKEEEEARKEEERNQECERDQQKAAKLYLRARSQVVCLREFITGIRVIKRD